MAVASGKSKSPRNLFTYGSFEESSSTTTTPGSGGREEGGLALNRSFLSLAAPDDQNLSSLTYASLADQMYHGESWKDHLSRSASTDFLNGTADTEALPSCLKHSKMAVKAIVAHQAAFWCALGITYMMTYLFDVEIGAMVAVVLAPLVLFPFIFEDKCWCMLALHRIFLADVPMNSQDELNWGWQDVIMVYQGFGLAEAFLVGLGFGVLSGWAQNRYHAWMLIGVIVAEGGAALTILISYLIHRVQAPIQLSRHGAFKNDEDTPPTDTKRHRIPSVYK
mmetsp:Transcript_15936/g.22360  ORF Transcript_15936/g.22360 Transcript_15936/m.22360 type:complete len:279 (-) Transcript_15936:409-1245(-)|eukprot:CAMPEP_0185258280 /NCGR_PEP_ID=MMETSP1359-20130426/7223_1 /TAXON_ID=552665 /ORGANISM="Bigelowiella longifila, Strain CCMP242" /LENGTH=278 /DNA_ID=CAMNT_0027843707 /DNA_START=172 /DNA_END=1008 /DNA_ORIENTATION=+